ncbi:MAG: putative IIA-like nitrogen-regulatory protein PtsN [Bacillota bacterium]|nr:putative IIA-like nitrogen-regulatory protein PtsN [Bacillota bacterium]
MAKLRDYIREDLIFLEIEAENDKALLKFVAEKMAAKGVVKDSFGDALIEREGYAPTGLKTDSLGVAIPHAEPQHVIEPCVAAATLKKPVVFGEMGTPGSEVDVRLVFCIALVDGDNHIGILQDVIALITESDLVPALVDLNSKEEFIAMLKTFGDQ